MKLIVTHMYRAQEMKEHNLINFEISTSGANNPHFSADKNDADFSYNQVFLNAVIGTLVKFGKSGKLEGYLAESWLIENNNLKWTFTLRDNLKDQKGNEISASKFVEILKSSLFEYQKNGEVISFKYLIGWNVFVKDGKNLKGLSSNGNKIIFEFEKDPDDLLELLRMPYFGYWLAENNHIISTAAYQIVKISDQEVVLKANSSHFNLQNESIKNVIIKFSNQDILSINSSTIKKVPFNQEQVTVDNGFWILSPPTRLEAFVLSPFKNNFFNEKVNRKIFQEKIRELYNDKIHSLTVFNIGQSSKQPNSKNELKYKVVNPAKKLTFALERNNYSNNELAELSEILKYSLGNIPFEVLRKEVGDKDWFKKTDSNSYFDSRVTSVDVGAFPDFMILDMMFCSKLGVNFPDPHNSICKLVENGRNDGRKFSNDDLKKFNEIIDEESLIIPIRHHSDKWLVSKDIDPNTLPPTTLYPQFETIRFIK